MAKIPSAPQQGPQAWREVYALSARAAELSEQLLNAAPEAVEVLSKELTAASEALTKLSSECRDLAVRLLSASSSDSHRVAAG